MPDRSPQPSHGVDLATVSATLRAIFLATFSVLPPFLLGALAVRVRVDLQFEPAALGLAVAWFFTTTALSAAVLGGVVEGWGTRVSLAVGASASAASMAMIGTAPSYLLLLLGLTVGGVANAVTQPAVNASLSQRIPPSRLGLAVGIKQSSIPAATLLGGIAVPTLGVSIGWRNTFLIAAIFALTGGVTTWFSRGTYAASAIASRARRRLRDTQDNLRSLIILTVGGLLGAGAATSLGAFLVDAGVDSGMSEGRAGVVFAIASTTGLVTRVVVGWLADAYPLISRYRLITAMLVVGVPGYLLLTSGSDALYVVGAVLAYAAGWGWPGLFHFAVISQNPRTPAASTGVIQTGVALGAGLGPLLMGVVAQGVSYRAAWAVASIMSGVGAACFWYGRIHLQRSMTSSIEVSTGSGPADAGRWEPRRAIELSDGVLVQSPPDGGTGTTLLKLGQGHRWRARAARPARLVVTGDGAELELGGRIYRPADGEGLTIPTGMIWTLTNHGPSDLVVALISDS